jgi:hypothetical protein
MGDADHDRGVGPRHRSVCARWRLRFLLTRSAPGGRSKKRFRRCSSYADGDDVVLETLKPTMLLQMFNEPSLSGVAREVETAIAEIMKEAAG